MGFVLQHPFSRVAAESSAVERRLKRLSRAAGLGEIVIDIAFCSDAKIAELNARFRQKTGPTDVLSFGHDDDDGFPAFAGMPTILGDLAIGRDVARRQARRYGHAIDVEVAVLAAHGLIHLLGYDHERGPRHARAFCELELSVIGGASIALTAALAGRAHAFSPKSTA